MLEPSEDISTFESVENPTHWQGMPPTRGKYMFPNSSIRYVGVLSCQRWRGWLFDMVIEQRYELYAVSDIMYDYKVIEGKTPWNYKCPAASIVLNLIRGKT